MADPRRSPWVRGRDQALHPDRGRTDQRSTLEVFDWAHADRGALTRVRGRRRAHQPVPPRQAANRPGARTVFLLASLVGFLAATMCVMGSPRQGRWPPCPPPLRPRRRRGARRTVVAAGPCPVRRSRRRRAPRGRSCRGRRRPTVPGSGSSRVRRRRTAAPRACTPRRRTARPPGSGATAAGRSGRGRRVRRRPRGV